MFDWQSFNQLSLQWAVLMINISIAGSILLLGAIMVNRCLKRLSAGSRFLLLFLALLSFFAIPAISGVVPAAQTVHAVQTLQINPAPSFPVTNQHAALKRVQLPNLIKPQIPLPDTNAKNHPFTLATGCFWIWILGLLVMGLRIASGIRGMYRQYTAGQHQDQDTIPISQDVTIKTFTRPGLHMPVTCGVIRPVVILPDNFREWPVEQRQAILYHEAAHIKRYDNLTNLISQLILAVYWFNPLVWLALSHMRINREKACDDYVLNTGIKPSAYAGILLNAIRAGHHPYFKNQNLVALQFHSKGEKRLRYILDNNINHRLPGWRTKFAVLLITLALLIPLSTFQLLAFDGTTPSQTESDYYRNSPEITIDSNAIKVTLTAKDGQKTVLSGSMNQFPVLWPEKDVRSSIVSPFGDFFHPILKKQTHHDGVDIHSHFRTPLVATADGIVDGEKLVEGYGKYVVIQHRYFKTRYGHLDEVTVKPGSVVKRGDIIGYSGNTGMSTGPHLHYEIRYDSKPLDPKAFLDAGKTLP